LAAAARVRHRHITVLLSNGPNGGNGEKTVRQMQTGYQPTAAVAAV